jgi:arylsulfatase A-like enzyme
VDIAPTIAELCGLPRMKTSDGKSFSSLLTGQHANWKRQSAFSCFNYMNNDPKMDESVRSYSSDLAKQFEQYRPSRALNDKNFCYVWNGWSNGTATLPKTMLGEFHGMLDDLAKNQSDSEYGDYLKTKNFIECRVPEELYDLAKDPACRENLSSELHYQKTLQSFRQGMKKVLRKTQDHELENYLSFLNNQ